MNDLQQRIAEVLAQLDECADHDDPANDVFATTHALIRELLAEIVTAGEIIEHLESVERTAEYLAAKLESARKDAVNFTHEVDETIDGAITKDAAR